MRLRSFAVALLAVLTAQSLPAQFLPHGTGGFGPLPQATFNGTPFSSGIPNTAVMRGGVGGVTLGLTATQRYTNPPLTNDGAGTFTALAGVDPGSPAGSLYARWNFDFYMSGSTLGNYFYQWLYQFTPNGPVDGGALGFGSAIVGAFGTTYSDSWNLGMAFLADPNNPNVAPPSGTFDPNALGTYRFVLAQTPLGGGVPEYVAIAVGKSVV